MEAHLGELFDICSNRHVNNPNSVQANKIARKGKIGTREVILRELRMLRQLTCEEIEAVTGISHQSCSARLSELRREGKIKIVGERKTRSGSPASVYQVT